MESSSSSVASSRTESHPQQHRYLLALFCCLQNALVGGLVFGWDSIERGMLSAPYDKGGAQLSPSETTQLFTYASSTACLSSLLLGPLLDAAGPRACLATSHLLVVLGCGGFALATEFWQFSVAIVLIAFGGPGIGLAIIHVANLFPKKQCMAISILSGSITLSFSMFAILEAAWENFAVSFRDLFAAYSLIVAVSMMGTLFLSPDEPYELDDDVDDEEEMLEDSEYQPTLGQEFAQAAIQTYGHHHQHPFLMTDQSLTSNLRRGESIYNLEALDEEVLLGDRHHGPKHRLMKRHSYYKSKEALQSGSETALQLMSLKDQPFLAQVQSPTFARAVVIFMTTSFLANFTIASLNIELEDFDQFNSMEQHDLSQVFTWFMSLGMPYGILVGWLMDGWGLEVCTFLTLLLGQLCSLLILLASLPHYQMSSYGTMVLGFAIYSLFRQFLYPVFLSYITARFGFKYFGILTGIGYAVSGVAQYFMARLAEWIHNFDGPPGEGWKNYHIGQIVVLAALLVIPFFDHRDMKRREAQMEVALRHPNKSPRTVARMVTMKSALDDNSPRCVMGLPVTASTPLKKQATQIEDVEYGSLLVPSKQLRQSTCR